MKRVVIIQEYLPHYRTKFFELLRENLNEKQIHLEVVFSDRGDSRFVDDAPPWATPVELSRFGSVVWHHAYGLVKGADLVIVPQEVKYLLSHVLLLRGVLKRGKLAFWGHGRNFQASDPEALAERLKRLVSRHAHWWFAYNALSARVVANLGYPQERITTVVNSIDTTSLIQRKSEVTEEELSALRSKLGMGSGPIGVFTGGLYKHKQIDFLLSSVKLVREQIPDFELIVIGEGPERYKIAEAATNHAWIHDVGKLDDQLKVPYWALSSLLLMPGLVGLVVIDSFALGVPIVTTNYPYHSPEIDYLENQVNGVIVNDWTDPVPYSSAVIELLSKPEMLGQLTQRAMASAASYSVEKMAHNMAEGIELALRSDENDLRKEPEH